MVACAKGICFANHIIGVEFEFECCLGSRVTLGLLRLALNGVSEWVCFEKESKEP